jgi:Glycosyl hydrolase family 26
VRSETVGYCALCNKKVLYVAAHGTGSHGGTRGEVMDLKPSQQGSWFPLPDGTYRRQRRPGKKGYKPHRCTRFPPQRWTREDVDQWYQQSMAKLNRVRQRWCVDATSWCVRQHQCLVGTDDPTVEDQIGEQIAVRNRRYAWGTSPNRIADCYVEDYDQGAIPLISLSPDGYTPSLVKEIALGGHDQYWRFLFALLAYKGRGFVRPWHSMNRLASPYGDPASYIRMWQRVHSIAVRSGAQLDWIWSCQEHDLAQVWRSYYPGDQYVDWVGLELVQTTFNQANPWRHFANEHRKPFAITDSYFEHGAPISDPSTGITYDMDGSVTGRSLIDKTAQDVKDHPHTAMYVIGGRVSSSTESTQQYKQLVRKLGHK